MNYLAHFHLAGPRESILVGTLLGDFVKGVLGDEYRGDVRRGIVLHRKTDSFTDRHPRTLISRNRFSRERRRYAGIIVDIAYDHFLAKQWERYCEISLAAFTARVYRVLEANLSAFSGRAAQVASRMSRQDWLASYRSLEGIGAALEGVAGRLKRPNSLPGSVQEIERHYTELEADFEAFFPDLRQHAAATLRELQSITEGSDVASGLKEGV